VKIRREQNPSFSLIDLAEKENGSSLTPAQITI
jgi:hypothetical protein